MRPELARRGLMPVERIFRAATRSQPIPGINTFLLSIHPYQGAPVALPDGTEVRRGATIGEIHFWNEHIATGYTAADNRELLWRFKQDLEADLRRLADHDAAGNLPADLVAFLGVTPLASVAGRLGFTRVELAPAFNLRLITLWQRLLGRVFRPAGHQRPNRLLSGACWISRQGLQQRYGSARP